MNGYGHDDALVNIEHQLQTFKEWDRAREEFVKSLVQRHRDLVHSHQRLQNDFDNEQVSRRNWQDKARTTELERDTLERDINTNCFVLALIDGDGAIFQNALLQAGNVGGSQASHQLLTEIKTHLQKVAAPLAHLDVVVQIYMNLDGLAKILCNCNIIKSPADLHAFTRAFSMSQNLFSVVDVGFGKERADHKLREMLRLFVYNQHCKHIILGGITQDNGYLPSLEHLRYTMQERISLLETTPSEPAFAGLPFKTLRCPTIFLSEKLTIRPSAPTAAYFSPTVARQVSAYASPVSVAPSPSAAPIQPLGGAQAAAQVAAQMAAKIADDTPPSRSAATSPEATITHNTPANVPGFTEEGVALPLRTSTTSPANPAEAGSSWAAVGKNGAIGVKNISITPTPKKPAMKKPFMLFNEDDERLDPVIDVKTADVDGLQQRIKTKGPVCNQYYLKSGECRGYCTYDHSAQLSTAEKVALRLKARQIPCTKLLACEDIECYFGHNCVWDKSCRYGNSCKFVETHGMNRTPYVKIFADGTEEYLTQ